MTGTVGSNAAASIDALTSGIADLHKELDSLAVQLHRSLAMPPPVSRGATQYSDFSTGGSAGEGLSLDLLATAELESRIAALEASFGLTPTLQPSSSALPSNKLSALEQQLAAMSSSSTERITALAEGAERAAASLRALAAARSAATPGNKGPDASVITSGKLAKAAEAAEALQTAMVALLPSLASRLSSQESLIQRLAALEAATAAGARRSSAR